MRAKIIGAGSIGNHLAQACRRAGWEVVVVDNDPLALERMRTDIYPKRYGAWDPAIQLFTSNIAPKGGFDAVFLGTPPDVHLSLALKVLREEPPRVLQIEKPLCSPTLEGLPQFLEEVGHHPATAIVVGYDHIVAENTEKAEEVLRSGRLGTPLTLDCEFRSHWKNIFEAHPWLSGPRDSYLGYWQRGGGAGGEHSHGLNLWQHFAHLIGAGRIVEVGAIFDYVVENGAWYDRACFLNLRTEKGLVGRLAQDVVTQPKKKFLDLQFERGSLRWENDVTKTSDKVLVEEHGKEKQVFEISKTRPDEFYREIVHIKKILDGESRVADSPIRLERAVETMCVLAAAHKSHQEKRTVRVEYFH